MEVHNGLNEHYKSNVKVGYLESHKSFCKLSLEIHYKKNPTLVYLMENLNLKYELLHYYFH